MTCGLAVKRPHDYEAYLGADAGGVEVKRSRAANPHCSPFRPQFGTLASSLPCSSAFAVDGEKAEESGPLGGLAKKHRLSGEQLETYLLAEVQYLKRRKLLVPRHRNVTAATSSTTGGVTMDASADYRRAAVSPSSSSHSGSESDGDVPASPPRHHRPAGSSSVGANGTSQAGSSGRAFNIRELYERPQFSLNQVKLICERLLKEQELRLRFEYETALNKKLEEQHDQYVQFAKEQIGSQNANSDNDYCFLYITSSA